MTPEQVSQRVPEIISNALNYPENRTNDQREYDEDYAVQHQLARTVQYFQSCPWFSDVSVSRDGEIKATHTLPVPVETINVEESLTYE
jgi:hypothetical protein